MNEIIVAVIAMAGSFAISYLTAKANRAKTTAEIDQIYARLGLDKQKAHAESANTWMDVARKAAEEYERVMTENVSLRKQVNTLNKRIAAMQKRIRTLELKKR